MVKFVLSIADYFYEYFENVDVSSRPQTFDEFGCRSQSNRLEVVLPVDDAPCTSAATACGNSLDYIRAVLICYAIKTELNCMR